jgi:parallel beta-helix repeat protein
MTQATAICSLNTFQKNISAVGGGIYQEQSLGSVVSGNRLDGNSASYFGGGIFITNCSPAVHNNLIINNNAIYNGGGIYVGDQNSEAQIINNTIIADTALLYGGGICANSVSPCILNTIVWDNVAPDGSQIYTMGGNTQVFYSDIQGGWEGTGNINGNPAFLDSTMRLADSSRCIGAGIDSIQIGGVWLHAPPFCFHGMRRPSPDNSHPDIGGCENPHAYPRTSVAYQTSAPLGSFALEQNYPNPFNPATIIKYQIPSTSQVTLKVFDILGRKVVTLVDEVQEAGEHTVQWSADNERLPTGVYLYRLDSGRYSETRKLIMLR